MKPALSHGGFGGRRSIAGQGIMTERLASEGSKPDVGRLRCAGVRSALSLWRNQRCCSRREEIFVLLAVDPELDALGR
jgi:hypothetical protein